MKRIILFLTLVFIINICNNELIIRSPKELRDRFVNGTIKTSLSNFGKIPYGYNTIGKLHFDSANDDKEHACKPINMPTINEDSKVDETPIVMIDRGNCTFVTKVRNVEEAGGHVALIINNIENEEAEDVVMADDGNGRDVSIPGVLISKKDGDKLKHFWRDNLKETSKLEDIIIEVNFDVEKHRVVDFDLYFISDNEAVYRLISEFYKYYKDLKDMINFKVHYITYQSPAYSESESVAVNNCYGGGRYCNTPGKYNTKDGRVIVKENIKQKCIYNYAYYIENQPAIYWDYMNTFRNLCLNNNKTGFTEACSNEASSESNVPKNEIDKCIKESFDKKPSSIDDLPLTGNITLLEEDNKTRRNFLVSFIPSLIINGRNYYGSWTAENVFEAVCAGFSKKPDICHEREASSSMGWGSVFIIVFIVIFINAVIFYFCRNMIRRKIVERIEGTDINHKINTVVTSYLALRDNK